MIETNHLQLIRCEPTHIAAFLRGKSELGALLQVAIPESWPHFPEAFSLPDDATPPQTIWGGYLFLYPKERVLVGNGGFKGQPDETGTVEIGYEIASEYWNRGFASEAAQGMIDFAFSHDQVQAVCAHTLGEKNASNRVLQKVGMKFAAEIDDADFGKIWRWEIRRDAYQQT